MINLVLDPETVQPNFTLRRGKTLKFGNKPQNYNQKTF